MAKKLVWICRSYPSMLNYAKEVSLILQQILDLGATQFLLKLQIQQARVCWPNMLNNYLSFQPSTLIFSKWSQGNFTGEMLIIHKVFCVTRNLYSDTGTFEYVRKVHRNLSRGVWKKLSSQNMSIVRIFRLHFELHFLKISTFFTFPDI